MALGLAPRTRNGSIMKTMVVVPTYNEAENLASLVGELFALALDELEIVVVDDGSPDGTGQLAEELARCYPGRLHIIHRTGRRGLGRAYREGFHYALKAGAYLVIQMDADFSHSPAYIPEFLERIQDGNDVVVGSRYVPGGKLEERWSLGRYLLSRWANAFYARPILRLKVQDATAGFKCWHHSALRGVDLDSIRSNGYVFQVEMAYVCERLGYRVAEIPIYFRDRRIGQSKMSIPVKIEAALRVWQVWWRHRRLRPRAVEV
jgi:dolichol-phosphate mannosyltransferase